jgi:hypothetical protein
VAVMVETLNMGLVVLAWPLPPHPADRYAMTQRLAASAKSFTCWRRAVVRNGPKFRFMSIPPRRRAAEHVLRNAVIGGYAHYYDE